MKAKTTIKSVTYTTMKARRAAEKGLNDILEITPLNPPTPMEFEKLKLKTENDVIERIECAKNIIKRFLGPHPPISKIDASKAKLFRDGKYNLLSEDKTIDAFTKEAIEIYNYMDCDKKEFIKSGYKPSFNQICNFMVTFEHFGSWYARRCMGVKAAMGNMRRVIGKEKQEDLNIEVRKKVAQYYRPLLLKYTKEIGDVKGKQKATSETLNKFEKQIYLKGKRPSKSLDNWLKIIEKNGKS